VSDLDTVIAALEERGSHEMAHELDPATASSPEGLSLAHRSLAELRRERERLDMMLAKAPPPVDAAIAKLNASRDALLARRQAWLAMPAGHGLRSAEEKRASPQRARVVASLDRRLAGNEEQLARLAKRQDEREAFLDDHQSAMVRREVLRRAEADRDLQLRFAALAVLPRAVTETLGQMPKGQREWLHWTNAIQEAVVERDQEGHEDGPQDGNAIREEGNTNKPDEKGWDPQTAQVIDRTLRLLEADTVHSVSIPE
jgi:hypothetical protein